MRMGNKSSMAALVTILVVSPVLCTHAQTAAPSSAAKPSSDAHGLTGVWISDDSRHYVNGNPEPPLTDWAKQNLLYKSIAGDALTGVPKSGKDAKPASSKSVKGMYAADQYGVVANDPNGEYPGKDCEPLSSPAMYFYPQRGVMEIIPTREGDRIFAFFAYHREWRTYWLNREHPKGQDPSYEGDSNARWDGDTLVVDTVNYNGETMLDQHIGHKKSDAFHLVERIHLLDHDHLEIDLTYFDPKAWGDKSWEGFRKFYKRTTPQAFEELVCSPRDTMHLKE